MSEKVRHIKGTDKPRLCGATGNFEPVGTEDELPLCQECVDINTERVIKELDG